MNRAERRRNGINEPEKSIMIKFNAFLIFKADKTKTDMIIKVSQPSRIILATRLSSKKFLIILKKSPNI